MLVRILIRNFALIGELELCVGPGLTVITGETGAGKSIILNAVGLLLGDHADASIFRDNASRCVIEMEFHSRDREVISTWNQINADEFEGTITAPNDPVELILRREISPQRKGRCLINDRVSSLKELKSLTAILLDLSGQEDALAVDRRQTQILLLDQIAGTEEKRREFSHSYNRWKNARQALDNFLDDYEKRQREEDLNRFHLEELRTAPLDTWITLEDCENQLNIQENALESREKLSIAVEMLIGGDTQRATSAADQLRELLQQIGAVAVKDNEIAAWAESLKNILLQIRELARDAESLAEARIPDLQVTQILRDQMDQLHSLLYKHRLNDLQHLRALRDNLGTAMDSSKGLGAERTTLVTHESECLEQCRLAALSLHLARKNGLKDLSSRVTAKLSRLSMEHARLLVDWNTAAENLHEQSDTGDLTEWFPSEPLMGLDKPDLLFSANPGQDPRPLGQVASGGEKSRLLLALKSLVREQGRDHTRIFDEIDAGISGETALMMGHMLSEMGKNQQIILVTHLPQIAALGDNHWHVTKVVQYEQTHTSLSVLNTEQRLETLARMIGGDRYGKAALQQALNLLNSAGQP
jgi:DNA repair protein RecN (Recombination protein N)